jgi:probable HAF family extracellular repeat protein
MCARPQYRRTSHVWWCTLALVFFSACQDPALPTADLQAAAPASFSLTAGAMVDLGTLGGPNSGAWGVNGLGAVVGVSDAITGATRASRWQNGLATDLGTLGGWSSAAYGINDHGDIVGQAYTSTGQGRASLWRNGVVVDLGTLGGGSSVAFDINNSGQVVGFSQISAISPYYAFLVQNGTMVNLMMGPNSHALAINDDGQLIVNSGGRAYLWSAGIVKDLGTLGGSSSYAHALNETGQVVGFSMTADRFWHAFLWEHGRMVDLGTLGGSDSRAYGINDMGQIVGQSTNATGDQHAVRWEHGTIADLGTLGGSNSVARAINAHGQIVGSSVTASGFQHAFSFSPFAFIGFFAPTFNPPLVNLSHAGSAIPIKFSLGGDRGLEIFHMGFPVSHQVVCDSSAPVGSVVEIATAGASGLKYDPATAIYNYVWKTEKNWRGTCRELTLRFVDGTTKTAQFSFTAP